ncbi:MAG TPA: hypothetical protein VHA35_24330 [Dongiaceae bacterium]|nr:hypothetical protein [Dongiaceae bacterium]
MTRKPRTVGPEDEDRRTAPPKRDRRRAREAGVESLPDGEEAAERDTAKPRDD